MRNRFPGVSDWSHRGFLTSRNSDVYRNFAQTCSVTCLSRAVYMNSYGCSSVIQKTQGYFNNMLIPPCLIPLFNTCVCFCSSSSCDSRGGCLRRRRRQPSEASGPAVLSPHPPCPPGWARFLGSGDLERYRFLCRCLPHLKKSKQQHKWQKLLPVHKIQTFNAA